MHCADVTQSSIFSYRTLEQRIPPWHPLRKLRELVDDLLLRLHDDFAALYAKTGRPSIPLERLLRASLIQTLYSIRSERQPAALVGHPSCQTLGLSIMKPQLCDQQGITFNAVNHAVLVGDAPGPKPR